MTGRATRVRESPGDQPLAAHVPTVAGQQRPTDLGATLVNEHVAVGLDGHAYFETAESAGAALVDGAAAQLALLSAAGVRTIVDTTTIAAGRDVAVLEAVGRETDVNIICSTGLDVRGGMPAAFRDLKPTGLADVYVRELVEAVPGSSSRAGVIVLSTSPAANADDAAAVLAAAFAFAETAVPVIALGGGALSEWQAASLIARGVDPEWIVAAQLDLEEPGFGLVDRVANTGVRLGFTRIGHEDALDDAARAALVAYAIRRHGAERVCLSMDSWAYWLGAGEGRVQRRGYGFLDGFLARLAEFGVERHEIDSALVSSVASLFGTEG